MKAEKTVAPSILSADFACLGRQVAELEDAGAEILHIDVMDGHFVPNISVGPLVVKALRRHSKMFFDVHLMIEQPECYVEDFVLAGADLITVHWESTKHIHRLVQQVVAAGCQVGVALNPGTPFEVLDCVARDLDMVLIMSVNPGFGGQAFIVDALAKIAQAARWRVEMGARYRVEVDGGINLDTAPLAAQAGADIVVAGAAVFGGAQPAEAWQLLQLAVDS
ncbi:MAG: ribulose-phosphate 3-epimerase [Peptococcaceae bacterium]|nr:ribulose-phosphate 3-epimerase [Peptococcaceae bacterium]